MDQDGVERMKVIEDKRKTKMFLVPSQMWMPDNTENTLMNIYSDDGQVIGDLEIGTDGFLQMVFHIPLNKLLNRPVNSIEAPVAVRIGRVPRFAGATLRIY